MIFPNLKAEMARRGYTTRDVAEVLGTEERNVRNRFNGYTNITFAQCLAVRDSLFPELTIDYLFDPEPRK